MTVSRGGIQREGLVELCRSTGGGHRVAEIGSFLGESAAIFTEYFDEVYCVDPWGVGLHMKDMPATGLSDAEMEAIFDSKLTDRICKVKMLSPGAAGRFPDGFFDLVYIDGAHDHDSVVADIRAWLPKATRFIGGHDFCDTGDVLPSVMEEFGMPHYIFADSSWLVRL